MLNFDVGKESKGRLPSGYYEMECLGARGGYAYVNNKKQYPGGAGAYGTFKFSAKDAFEYTVMVGERGKSNPKGNQSGGWPDGGRSGEDLGSAGDANGGDDGSGSGGGSTRLYINGDLAIVCAGGSGAAYKQYGAPGGGIGYNYVVATPDEEENTKFRTIWDDTMTTKVFKGCDGQPSQITPGAGGGGGYFGGDCLKFDESDMIWWKRGAASGKSFINKSIEGLIVTEFHDGIGVSTLFNDGEFSISPISCPTDCVNCETQQDKCDECSNKFYLKNSQCFPCSENCYKCSNGNSCDVCMSGFYMTQDKRCVEECPERTYHLENSFECIYYADFCSAVDSNGICIKCLDNSKKLVNGVCEWRETHLRKMKYGVWIERLKSLYYVIQVSFVCY